MAVVIRKSQPTAGDVHVNRPLTDLSVGWMQTQDNFVAGRVFPIVPVSKQSDSYFTYERADFYRNMTEKRAPGAESAGTGYNIGTDQYQADVYAIHKDVPDQVRANADAALNPDREATEFTSLQLMLNREVTWAAEYFVTGVWATDTTVSPKWDAASSTPIEDITGGVVNMAAATGYRPNTIVMSPNVFNVLKNHSDIIDRIKYTQTGVVTLDMLARLFEVERAFVTWGVQNTAAEGATEATDFIMADHLLLMYVNPSPGLMVPSAGYTFTWNGLFGAGAFGNRIRRFRLERNASDRIEGEMAYDQKVVAAELGELFASPLT